MEFEKVPFTELLSKIVDNRGRTCPTAVTGFPLIATNCVRNELLYPAFEKVRYVSADTYENWFRGHPAAGDLIFVCKGTPGRVCLTPDPVTFCIAQDMVAVRADRKKVYPKYLFALLRSPQVQTQIGNMHVGTLIPHFKKGDFDKLLLPVPDRKAQEIIGDTYFELSAKIELNRRMNATLEVMARTLFQSWFVDFDPVRARLDGRDPVGLDPATAALFPDSFQDSELGRIPTGWRVQYLEEVAERVAMGPFGSSIKVSTFVNEGIPVISGQHLHDLMLDDSEFNFVTETHATQLHRSNVQRGDVIFTHAGSIGQVALIPESSKYTRYVVSQRQFFLRCDRTKMSPLYIVLYFKTPEGQHRLLANTSSTGVPSIAQPVTYLRQLQLVIPPLELLARFDELAGGWLKQIAANLHQSRTLATLRDTLLPKMLCGEIKVDPRANNISI
jgi:type I restriction enzyme S subunit